MRRGVFLGAQERTAFTLPCLAFKIGPNDRLLGRRLLARLFKLSLLRVRTFPILATQTSDGSEAIMHNLNTITFAERLPAEQSALNQSVDIRLGDTGILQDGLEGIEQTNTIRRDQLILDKSDSRRGHIQRRGIIKTFHDAAATLLQVRGIELRGPRLLALQIEAGTQQAEERRFDTDVGRFTTRHAYGRSFLLAGDKTNDVLGILWRNQITASQAYGVKCLSLLHRQQTVTIGAETGNPVTPAFQIRQIVLAQGEHDTVGLNVQP